MEVASDLSNRGHHYENDLRRLVETMQAYLCQQSQTAKPRIRQTSTPTPHKIKYRLTETQVQCILSRYEAGVSSATVGKAFGISKTTVISILNEHGIAVRKLGLTGKQKKHAMRLRQSGLTLNEISRQIGSNYSATQRYIASADSADQISTCDPQRRIQAPRTSA